jgi:cytochrome c553
MMNIALQVALYGFVVAALPAMTASVVRAEDVADGRKIAQSYCSRCHAVAPPKQKGWTNAPSFAEIAVLSRLAPFATHRAACSSDYPVCMMPIAMRACWRK